MIWPARRGRQVTAVDVSRTAPERAAATAPDITGRVAWTRADLTVREPLLPPPVPTTPATPSCGRGA
ncbi:hypothetical protein ACIOHE_15255 [Streptomyces sp. NPDC087851]|uniref:hypothetical protein n=1 Tax=Streptomyces sp. NPDC087851 TaxID=3365810 RepID=UPI0038101C35